MKNCGFLQIFHNLKYSKTLKSCFKCVIFAYRDPPRSSRLCLDKISGRFLPDSRQWNLEKEEDTAGIFMTRGSTPGTRSSTSETARRVRRLSRFTLAQTVVTRAVTLNLCPCCAFVLQQGQAAVRSGWRQTSSGSFPVLSGSSTSTMWTSIHRWSLAVCAPLSFSSMRNCSARRTPLTGRCFFCHINCTIR